MTFRCAARFKISLGGGPADRRLRCKETSKQRGPSFPNGNAPTSFLHSLCRAKLGKNTTNVLTRYLKSPSGHIHQTYHKKYFFVMIIHGPGRRPLSTGFCFLKNPAALVFTKQVAIEYYGH